VEIGESVQRQCAMAAERIIDELEKKFPAVDVMDALGVLYPQYWTLPTVVSTFPQHLEVLKPVYGQPKRLKDERIVPALIDAHRLSEQSSFFKISRLNNAQWAVDNNFGVNPFTRL
jgi:hypothetical protein